MPLGFLYKIPLGESFFFFLLFCFGIGYTQKKLTPLFISVARAGYIEIRFIRDRFSQKGVYELFVII